MRRDRGFTLMEMLVALLVGAIVVSQLYIMTRAIAHDTTKQQMETEAMQRARIGLEMLTADFSRAGMMTSPNPARDPDSMVSEDSTSTEGQTLDQHAFKRPAIVHLNRDDADRTDSVLLVGSFVTSNTYQGYIDAGAGQATITLTQTFATQEDCLVEFNPAYAFAHVFAPNGQSTDVRIESATCAGSTDCECSVTFADGELFVDGPSAFATGQLVTIAANQAALYLVRPIGDHDALVRYFVDFDTDLDLEAGCNLADFFVRASGDFTGAVDTTTAKVIADYVTDFQVWFRNVYKATPDDDPANPPNGEWVKPRYYDVGTLGSERMLPCDTAELFDATNGATSAGCAPRDDYLGCVVLPDDNNLGPEHVRSAVIRLGVRGEKTDHEVMKLVPDGDWNTIESQDVSNDDNRLVRYNVARPPAGDVGAYKVRTVVTEVAMPNIAARMASFQRVGTY